MYRLRAQRITIDLPNEDSEPWVHAVLQKIFKDKNYNNTQIVDRSDQLNKKMSEFFDQIENMTDPITQETFNLSGAGLAEAIRVFMLNWMIDSKGGTINNHGHLIKE